MSDFEAVMIAEGEQEAASPEQYYEAWQHLIDRGLTRTLQGHFGRTAAALIHAGICHN